MEKTRKTQLELHEEAFQATSIRTTGRPRCTCETALVAMIRAFEDYAYAYNLEFPESEIGEDGVLGPHWVDIGKAIKGLMNGPSGNLDGGEVCKRIRATVEKHKGEMEP